MRPSVVDEEDAPGVDEERRIRRRHRVGNEGVDQHSVAVGKRADATSDVVRNLHDQVAIGSAS